MSTAHMRLTDFEFQCAKLLLIFTVTVTIKDVRRIRSNVHVVRILSMLNTILI